MAATPPNESLRLFRTLLRTLDAVPQPNLRRKLRYNVHHVFRLYAKETDPQRLQTLHAQARFQIQFFAQFREWPREKLDMLFRF